MEKLLEDLEIQKELLKQNLEKIKKEKEKNKVIQEYIDSGMNSLFPVINLGK